MKANRVIALLVIVLWALPFSHLAAASQPPNIVLIISDDQHWGDYGFQGHPQLKTPHLDQLARESLTFTHGYVTSSLCCPSLASIITGKYPHQHNVTGNDPARPPGVSGEKFYQSPEFAAGREVMSRHLQEAGTLPQLLAQQKYLSFQSGKWWQNSYKSGGFTQGMTLGGRHGDQGLEIGRKTMEPIYDFIATAKKAEQPFMVWYAPLMPHDPHTPPERFLNRVRDRAPSPAVAKYWGMVEWFDETCGQLLDHLDQQGLRENTIVVFLSDNGWITDPQTGRYALRSKQSPYEGGLRTPILLRWPGHWQPTISHTPVSAIDLFPTLLTACGIPVPSDRAGINLADAAAVKARPAIFGACFTHDSADLEHPARNLRWRWCIADRWKLIVPNPQQEPQGTVELFDLEADPGERVDLAKQHPERIEQLQMSLRNWWPGD